MAGTPQDFGSFYNAFAGKNHNKSLLLYAGWAAAVSGYVMYSNYHPSLPPKQEAAGGDNTDFEAIIREMEAEEKQTAKK
eukprot:UN09669